MSKQAKLLSYLYTGAEVTARQIEGSFGLKNPHGAIYSLREQGHCIYSNKATLSDGQDDGEMLITIESKIGELYEDAPNLSRATKDKKSTPTGRGSVLDSHRGSPGKREVQQKGRGLCEGRKFTRSKQQGRRLPLRILSRETSTRRARVSGFFVAPTQRTHSQRAIGVSDGQVSARSSASSSRPTPPLTA